MSMADDYKNEYNPDDYYGRTEGYIDYKAKAEELFKLFGIEVKGAVMQLSQVPLDGNKYDVVATITNLIDAGKPVGQKGYLLQKFDLADASKAVKGVAYFYAGNQPDMALPLNWNNQTMTISVSAKQNGQYTNFTASIPRSGAQFAGQGNPAAAAPIANAMADSGVQYANQAQPPVQQAHQAKAEPDWDEIARGKVRCNLICALLQNSAVDANMIEPTQKLAEQYMNYIFTGQTGMAPPTF
jgi:hypothetical protein